MNTNFVWHADRANHIFYVPSDEVKQIENKDLAKDFEKKVTKDGREIFFLKSNPLPEYIKSAFESITDVELKTLQRKVADINKSENARLGLLNIPPHLMREGVNSKLDEISKVTLAHASTRLREMLNNTPEEIKKNKNIMKLAVEEGNTEILTWAYNQKAPIDFNECFQIAAKKEKKESIEWLMKAAKLSFLKAAQAIGKAENVDIFKWFDEKYHISPEDAHFLVENAQFSSEIRDILIPRASRYRSSINYTDY